MVKKAISSIVAMTLVLSIVFVPVSASQTVEELNVQYIEMEIEGNSVCFSVYENGLARYVTYEENGKVHEVSYNLATGALSHDNTVISVIPVGTDFGIMTESSLFATTASHTWVEYDREDGDVLSEVMTVTGWTATLIALVGGTFAYSKPDVIEEIALQLVQLGAPTVYFRRIHFYKSPVTTSRPETASAYYFYEDITRMRLVGILDGRYY